MFRLVLCVCVSSAVAKEQLGFPGVEERLQRVSFSSFSVWFQSPGAHRRVRGAQASFFFSLLLSVLMSSFERTKDVFSFLGVTSLRLKPGSVGAGCCIQGDAWENARVL